VADLTLVNCSYFIRVALLDSSVLLYAGEWQFAGTSPSITNWWVCTAVSLHCCLLVLLNLFSVVIMSVFHW